MTAKNYAHYWCSLMIERVIAHGIDHFFVAPGSRSTPIVSAIARNPFAYISWGIDERSLAFMCLGYSKRAQKAGVIVVTSGTAVANLYPAVVESFFAEVPMMLLTADRPFELRDAGANQTINQANLFAHHINKSFDLAPPTALIPWVQSQAVIDHAVRFTEDPKKGPVHINLQLREPVANLAHKHDVPWQINDKKPTAIHGQKNTTTVVPDIVDLIDDKRGLIVVGEMSPAVDLSPVLALAQRCGWPIFADISSQLRFVSHAHVIYHFDLLLLNHDFMADFALDSVLKIGGSIVSKRFLSWIEQHPELDCLYLSHTFSRMDPTGRFQHYYVPDVAKAVMGLADRIKPGHDASLSHVKMQQEKLLPHLSNFLSKQEDNEAYVCSELVDFFAEPINLFVSSSMPIRDLDQCAKPKSFAVTIMANRGASGIDGIISSAAGMALATPSVLSVVLLGDVAFLHDSNGLMLARSLSTPLLIVVINNGGGGIFHFLSIACEKDVVTPYLDTPHDVEIASLCRAHHIEHVHIKNATDFREGLRYFASQRTTMVLEVVINKATNVHLHKEFYELARTLC